MERMMQKIKIDLQVIMIIWGEETEPLSFLSLFSFFSIYFFMFIWDFLVFLGGGGERDPSAPSESASGMEKRFSDRILFYHITYLYVSGSIILFQCIK